MRTRSLLSLAIASTALVGATRLDAQPTRDHRTPPPPPPANPTRDHRPQPAPPPSATGPTEAPPTPREEKFAARAGFVWIAGRWDWKGKWDWVPGHWERERAGQSWHPGHWDKNGASWTFTEGSWGAGAAVAPPVPPPGPPPVADDHTRDHRPHKAPPPPRTETASVKAGFIWVPGRWDWQNDDWKWVDGHWERERAHKKWRADRWDLQGDVYVHVGGDWVDETAANEPPPTNTGVMPPVPPPGDDHVRDHRHDWKLDRPAVSSYWPNKGKAGTRVVIHGVNFPANATVVWGSEPIKAAKVTPDKIVFEVPATATSGTIALRREHGRDLIVGSFEIAAIDAEAEAKRILDEQRKAAEAAWVARQKDLAKDRAAREAAWQQREQELEASREQRRQERVAAIRAKFQAAFLADADTQAELTIHAERVAQLGRAREVAEISSNGKLVIRIDIATTRETTRHDERMTSLEQSFRMSKGGAP